LLSTQNLFNAANGKRLPITIVAAERQNEWNIYCTRLQKLKIATELEIPNLSEAEIHGLLDLLTRHGALGLLLTKDALADIHRCCRRRQKPLPR
jgi:hypothetical protein